MIFGNLMLALAVASGGSALFSYGRWALGNASWQAPARRAMDLLTMFVLIASGFHLLNILTHQFQYSYVTNFTDRALPPLLLASTFWAGQAGSFLLWSLWSVLFALVLSWGLRRSSWEPYVLTPYLLITLCIVAITWASGPFKLLDEVPADGNGLNPLLRNYWMAIHPPILFTGFTTMAGPFAFAVAALWKRDYDGWVAMARPWTLLAWACLGTGLSLGGFWAYDSLGWGGFWGWDPVENSSLVPWLLASALLHGFTLQGARGSFKKSNLTLAIFGYLMVIYSTFLTRSGVLGNFSIHSFVDLGLMGYLVGFIALFGVLGFGMLVWRWREVGRRVLYSAVLSREFGLVTCVVLFLAITLIVGVGTSLPVITLLPFFATQQSLDLSFYGPTVAPFGLLLLLTMAVGPLLGWQRSKYGSLRRTLRLPFILTGVTVLVCLLLNINYPLALLFVAGAVFAASANAVVVAKIWRAGPLKLGGYLCHIGVGLMFVGVIGTTVYKQSAALQLTADVPQTAFGRQFTFRGLVLPPDDELKRTAVQVEVMNPADGTTWVAEAPYYVFEKTGALVIHPDILASWWSDLYLEPSQYLPPAQLEPGVVQIPQGTSAQAFGYTLAFREFAIDRAAMQRGEMPASIGAVLALTAPDGATTTLTPTMRLMAGVQPDGVPLELPGGATITMIGADPNNQAVTLQFGGVDLSRVNPDDLKPRLFAEVSRQPGIKLVWGGISLGVLGGLLAMLRRWRESAPAADIPSAPVSPPILAPERAPRQPDILHTAAESEVP
jgi:cytochrome c-type biogenesis protein CcmF